MAGDLGGLQNSVCRQDVVTSSGKVMVGNQRVHLQKAAEVVTHL